MNRRDPYLYNLSVLQRSNTLAVMESFSDASEIGGYTAVASLLFRKKHLKPFEKEWGKMLRKFGLSHFHMTDCNAARGEYAGWDREIRDSCAREAIKLMVTYATKGIGFSVNNRDFDEIVTKKGIMPNPVSLGVWATLFDVREWADNHDKAARITYVFEAGDEEQASINNLFNSIDEDPVRRVNARYRKHLFVSKRSSYPTQAADILAWHVAKNERRRDEGRAMRADFAAIVSQLHVSDVRHDRAWLLKLVSIAQKNAGPLGNELSGVAFLRNKFNASQMRKRLNDLLSSES